MAGARLSGTGAKRCALRSGKTSEAGIISPPAFGVRATVSFAHEILPNRGFGPGTPEPAARYGRRLFALNKFALTRGTGRGSFITMKERLAGILLLLVIAAIVAGIAWNNRESGEARNDRLVREFLEVVPDSLDSARKLEIQQLFNMFYVRAGRGEVAREDVERITSEMQAHVDRGRITPTELVRFMADVGYTTYKKDPRYNLADKSVDHPVLNPEAGVYPVGFDSSQYDSAFWADFEKWKKENPEMADPKNYEIDSTFIDN
jgi:hypothetical protein